LPTILRGAARYVLACLVVTQVTGCASYKQGVFPTTDLKSEANQEVVEIRVGSEVQVETTDGDQVSGSVVRVSESELAIGKASNYGFEEWVFSREEIARVRVRKESTVASFAFSTVGVIVITFVMLAVLAGATGGIQFGD